jgi:hypothetical protein
MLDWTTSEVAFENLAVDAQNVTNSHVDDNYFFMADMPITGGTHFAFPICYQSNWNISVPANGVANDISHNSCDGIQVTGYTGRYGVVMTGPNGTNEGSHLGVNELTNLDVGFQTSANLTHWILEKQIFKNVATEWTNLSAAGANITVPPLSVKDGSAAAAGLVGEVISSTVASGSAVSLTTGTPKTVTSVSLTAGDCDCRGEGDFTGTATTIAGLGAGINTRTNVFPVPTAVSANLLNATFVAASNNYLPLAPFRVNVTSATSEFLIALANFVGGTENGCGRIECRRTR